MKVEFSLSDWLAYGQAHGYCTAVACDLHDGVEVTEEELSALDHGDEPCIPVVRIWAEMETPSSH
jgi:hypothetical protein